MSERFRTTRAFYLGAACLTLIATVLRTLSLTLCLDRTSGYFRAGAALPVCYQIFTALSLLALLLFPLLALKDRVPQGQREHTKFSGASALLLVLLFFLNFIGACTQKSDLLPTAIWVLGLLFLLGGTVYFILQAFRARLHVTANTLTVFGCLTIFGVACLIAFTYFDIATPMNAPHKTDLHLALLAVLLYLLYELREIAGIPRPRALATFTALTFFLTLTVGTSDLVAHLFGVYSNTTYLFQDVLLIGFALYTAARGASLALISEAKN